jgi:hypothetical protein
VYLLEIRYPVARPRDRAFLGMIAPFSIPWRLASVIQQKIIACGRIIVNAVMFYTVANTIIYRFYRVFQGEYYAMVCSSCPGRDRQCH